MMINLGYDRSNGWNVVSSDYVIYRDNGDVIDLLEFVKLVFLLRKI